ncbi:MAG: hypothetical protein JXR91_01665 [Deltaproteobacteria bacterium]|nr:hypothetical protein [Deltaproteobacteria bacterium]
MRKLLIVISLFSMVILESCGVASTGSIKKDTTIDPVVTAHALAEAGDYLQASYYLESAIKTEEDEIKYLPYLIDAMVRSRRLLASLESLERLIELQPDNNEARELYSLIREITGTDNKNIKGEENDRDRNIQRIN